MKTNSPSDHGQTSLISEVLRQWRLEKVKWKENCLPKITNTINWGNFMPFVMPICN